MQENIKTTMTPGEVAKALLAALAARQPLIVWGAPGIGKSQVVAQTAAAAGRELIDIRASLLDPVDLRGLPSLDGGRTVWNAPGFLPVDGCAPTVVFLDELNRAPIMTQNALFQLVLDRKLGEYKLPDNCEIIAACNRETDGGGVQRMPQALANRFVHIDMEVDVNDWSKWAVTADIHPAVIAFVRWRPNLLHSYDAKSKAFPSPRSWEFVSRITHQAPGNGIELALYVGAVGQGAAIAYAAFMRLYRELPSLTASGLNPTTSPVPNEPSALFAGASGRARMAKVTNIGRLIQYTDRMPPEYRILFMKDATGRDASITATAEFTRWSIAHADVVL